MPTKTERAGPDPAFLARVYQFERDQLLRGPLVRGDGYTLSAVWRPGHPVWKKLAACAAASRIDPVRYVRWSLSNPQAKLPPDVPEPNRLLERGRLELYTSELAGVRQEIASRFKRECEIANRNLTVRTKVYKHPAEVAQVGVFAGGNALGLSPLFCYVAARCSTSAKVLRLADRLEADALFQFSRDPDENAEVYGVGGHLPNGIAARAAEFYVTLVDGFADRVARGASA